MPRIRMSVRASFFGATLTALPAVPRGYLLASMSDPKLLALMIPSLSTLNKPQQHLNSPLFGRSMQTLASNLGSGGANGGFNPLYQIGGAPSIQLASNFSSSSTATLGCVRS